MFFIVGISSVCRQYVIIIIANFSMLVLGMEIAWISPVLVKLRDMNQTTLSLPITEGEGAWIASMAPLVGLFVMSVSGFLIDRLGRKSCIVLVNIPRLIMSLLCIFTTEVWMLLLARGMCGVSDVLSLSVVPTYASEIASKEIRGALGTITQVMSAAGMLIMLSIGPFVPYRTMNMIYSAVIFLLFVPQLFLPESPYFLYVKGRKEDAIKVLTSIRNSEEIVAEETNEYSLNDVSVDKKELLKDKTTLKSIGKVIFLSIGVQIIGYNAVSAYLQTIFESTKTRLKPEIASLVIGCIQLLAPLCTIFLADRFGRKPILTVTLIGMAVGLVGLGTFFKLTQDQDEITTEALNYLPLVSIILIIYCFNAGIGSILWMLVAELFDGPSRAFGVSFGVFFTTLFIFLTTNYFNSIINTIGPAATYWMFGGNCIITCLFILVFIPETKGRTFSEIQLALGRKTKEESNCPS